ncbi:hydroxymethylglutaryl-CoA lyase [Xanthobacter sp. KR7-225]|uniref:hydroxymethylglutaryl-CoA lyase n=1 Tax=Xanthobacter sp. KR7-225 TaxID=3156613 RepID=UPI0032B33B81
MSITLPSEGGSRPIRVVEVGPRDGLQNETRVVPVAARIALIRLLIDAGLKTMEAGSFVSPRWVPQMEGTDRVLAGLDPGGDVVLPVLVPNLKGLEAARAAGAETVAVFAAATEAFSRANLNADRATAMGRFAEVIAAATASGIRVRGYVSCALHCPYEGWVHPDAAADLTAQLTDLGCYEVSLCDTTGQGTPDRAEAMIAAALARVPAARLAVHFHDTGGRALDNTERAIRLGIGTVDSAIAGLGGCPYSPGAAGNLATEKLVARLTALGFDTGVDLAALALARDFIRRELSRPH